jgi:hypothetical protein
MRYLKKFEKFIEAANPAPAFIFLKSNLFDEIF